MTLRNSAIVLRVGLFVGLSLFGQSAHSAAQSGVMVDPIHLAMDGIAWAQPEDAKVQNQSVYAGRVFFTWAAISPKNEAPNVGSKYMPYSRDHDRSHTFAWYTANHPDWIVYKADRKTPAYGFIYPQGNAMSLDISNPAVREFYFNTYVAPAIADGYKYISLDNVQLTNWDQRSGHFDARGEWVQQFSGEKVDKAYAVSVLDWVGYLSRRIHAAGVGVAANIKYPGEKSGLIPEMRKMLELVDTWSDEQGFTLHRASNISDEAWQEKFDFVRSIANYKYYVAVNQLSTPHLADASPEQIDWAVANYYLYRENKAMLIVCGIQEYGPYLDFPQRKIDLGHPLSTPVHDVSGAWTRSYSKGMVVVNPSSKRSASVALKGTWVDTHDHEYNGKVNVASNSGLMLMPKAE